MGPLDFSVTQWLGIAVGVNAIFTLILWAMVYNLKFPPKEVKL